MRRIASVGIAVILLLSSFSQEATAQVVRTTSPSAISLGASLNLPLSSPTPLLNSGLSVCSPSLSLSVPILTSSPIPLPLTAKTNNEFFQQVPVTTPLPVIHAVQAAKPQPPQAAPDTLLPSASVLFDGITLHAASAGDPVIPDGDPEPSRPLSRPITPHHLESGPPHDDHDHPASRPPIHESALKRAMAVALTFIAIEMIGGAVTGNAALQADAFHLLSDQLINAAALFSAWHARKPGASPKVEAVVGLLAAGVIGFTGVEMGLEAWHRFFVPGAAATWSVAAFALASLAANLSSALILRRHHEGSLGVKSAFMVAMTDTVGSIGVIVSAAAAILLGWGWAEPVVVALISVMIARIAWSLGKPAWKALVAPKR